jgi:hypothetical protein
VPPDPEGPWFDYDEYSLSWYHFFLQQHFIKRTPSLSLPPFFFMYIYYHFVNCYYYIILFSATKTLHHIFYINKSCFKKEPRVCEWNDF